jgi:hypothetical protein
LRRLAPGRLTLRRLGSQRRTDYLIEQSHVELLQKRTPPRSRQCVLQV